MQFIVTTVRETGDRRLLDLSGLAGSQRLLQKFCDERFCPSYPSGISLDEFGFIGVDTSHTVLNENVIEDVLRGKELRPDQIEALALFFDLSLDKSNYDPKMVIDAMTKDDWSDVLGIAEADISLKGQRILETDYGRIVGVDAEGFKAEYESDVMQVVYGESPLIFLNGAPVSGYRDVEREFSSLSALKVTPSKQASVDVKPAALFRVVGKIDLHKVAMTKENTKSDIQDAYSRLTGDIYPKEDDSKEDMLSELYRQMNKMAAAEANPSRPYYLLTEEYIETAPVTGNMSRRLDMIEGLAHIGRKSGRVVLPGTPMIDPSLFSRHKVWYVAELI